MSTDHFIPQVDALRERIAEARAEDAAHAARKFSNAEGEAALDRACDQIEAHGRRVVAEDVGRLIASGSISRTALWALQGGAMVDRHAGDVFAVICAAIGRTAIRALYREAINALPDGLDKDAKAARRADLARELDRLETAEELFICRAAQSGVEIRRRRDADPEIVMAVHVDSEGGDCE